MSRNSRWYTQGVATLLSFATLPAATFGAWPELTRRCLAQPAAASAQQNGLADGYDPRRDPDEELAAARAEAKKSGKKIFVEVGGEWCTWCHILDQFFHEHPDLELLRDKNYVSMKVSMSQENPNRVFLSRFPYIHGYPHIFILDAAGNRIHSQPTNVLEDGRSYNAKRFQKSLAQFVPKRST
jgi:thiol:disulfide interchange protein